MRLLKLFFKKLTLPTNDVLLYLKHKNLPIKKGKNMIKVGSILLLLSMGTVLTANKEDMHSLQPHELWWETNAPDNHVSFAQWLGGPKAQSRVTMREHVRAKGYKSILDIPAGGCVDFDGLRQDGLNIDYVAMDITPKLIKQAQARGIKAKLGSIEAIPLADKTFDIAYSRHILEHLEYYEKAIDELIRVAKKEVFITFFIKPHAQADVIDLREFNDHLLYHNVYDQEKFEHYVKANPRVEKIEWEDLNPEEIIVHIYLKDVKESEPTYYSQPYVGQDRYLNENYFHNKKDGFFVDIGAHDGISHSNSYFFEKTLGWKGICIEAHPRIFKTLEKQRSCTCVNVAVSRMDGEVEFIKVEGAPEMLSGIADTYDPRHMKRLKSEIERDGGSFEKVKVPSQRLMSIIEKHPVKTIDYLSIDTEGNELEILKSIDFEKVSIGIISVENNYQDPQLRTFLESKNFNYVTLLAHQDEIYVNKEYNA